MEGEGTRVEEGARVEERVLKWTGRWQEYRDGKARMERRGQIDGGIREEGKGPERRGWNQKEREKRLL